MESYEYTAMELLSEMCIIKTKFKPEGRFIMLVYNNIMRELFLQLSLCIYLHVNNSMQIIYTDHTSCMGLKIKW